MPSNYGKVEKHGSAIKGATRKTSNGAGAKNLGSGRRKPAPAGPLKAAGSRAKIKGRDLGTG